VLTASEGAVFELYRRWGEIKGKHSQCRYTDSRTLATREEPETSGGRPVQDWEEDITASSPFEKKCFWCLCSSCELETNTSNTDKDTSACVKNHLGEELQK